jgi:kumamolisin
MSKPAGHQSLRGSERIQPGGSRRLGPADPAEQVTIRVIVRRRGDRPAADLETHLSTAPMQREALSADDYAERFGAAPSDLDDVAAFLRSGGLTIEDAHPASRTIMATGTVAQLSDLFSVTLRQYRGALPPAGKLPGRPPGTHTYRSHEGPVQVPAALADVIVGVFGLDNRRITGKNGAGDPPVTNPTSVPQIMQRYNFPTSGAAGQTVGIFASFGSPGIGYAQSDIDSYYAAAELSGLTAPTPVPVQNIDGTANDPASPDGEATQDICIASTVAQGADIAVYFNAGDENGWLGVLQKATFPAAGEPTPSVLSSSFFICEGDDPAGRAVRGTPTSFLDALTLAFQDAGGQGLTVCIASGDTGSDSGVGDGQQHVQYPGSDPWVLSCGGTTVGLDNSSNPVEYVWNDTMSATLNDGTTVTFAGATGGGVSAYFAQPAYQFGAGVPPSLVDGHVGRGVPDVAANASWDSGYYPMYTIGNDPNPWNGDGTSASAPLYAGLFAVINAALGASVGFINPVLYALGNTVCDDVNPAVAGGPADNGLNGVTGYPAGAGWDACTGWGSINGSALLDALQAPQILTRECTFIVDRSTYGKDEVDALLQQAPGHAVIDPALWVTVDGYTPADLGITSLSGDPHFPVPPTPAQLAAWAPSVTMAPPQPSSWQFVPVAVGSDDPALPASVQQFTFAYQALFTDDSAFAALSAGEQSAVALTADVQSSTSLATIALVNEPDPFITNGATSWLSIDLRVFSILQYESRFSADLSAGPNQFIQNVMANLTAGSGTAASGDSFDLLPVDEEPNVFVYPTTFVGGTQVPVFNFAIARVRYRGLSVDAADVRVFFRTFQAQSTNTTYDQSTTYRRLTNHETPAQPVPALGVNGGEFVTVPFFAAPRIDPTAQDLSWQSDDFNVQTIPHDSSGAQTDAYFGCWLDLNQQANAIPTSFQPGNLDGPWSPGILGPIQQAITRNPHQCLVAEIALDPTDPQIPPGGSPSTSDKLAQRNLGWSDLAS